jgi:hypothetical protein
MVFLALSLTIIHKATLRASTAFLEPCFISLVSRIHPPDGTALVADLTGCTAAFFYEGNNELVAAYHILCGNEGTDGNAAVYMEADANFVTIVADTQANADNLIAAIWAIKPDIGYTYPIIYGEEYANDIISARDSTGTHDVTLTVQGGTLCPTSDKK